VRCFVAVDLAGEVRAAVAAVQERLRTAVPTADVRWTDVAGFHVTLRFLGQVAEGRLPEIRAALAAATRGRPPLVLAAGGLGAFPGLRRPRVVWAGVTAEAAALTALAGAVDGGLEGLGLGREARPFHGHVTLGRVRSARGAGALGAALERLSGAELGAWTAAEVVLYRSHLGPAGARYEPVARFPLADR